MSHHGDPRDIWLKTLSGVPQSFAWAMVKQDGEGWWPPAAPVDVENPTAAEEAARKTATDMSWKTALMGDELAASGWDAVITAWRRIPMIFCPGWLDHASSGRDLTGNVLTVAGCTADITVPGRSSNQIEPFAPDVTVGTLETLVAFVEAVGQDLDFTEASTFKRIRVFTGGEPGDPFVGGRFDSGIYRQTSDSQAVRADA
jgi:hypothetical protein